MLPWLNCWATSATRTPLPAVVLLTPVDDTEKSSANCTRDPLKPVVPVFAMLLAVTARSALAAFNPEMATRNDIAGISCFDWGRRRP